MVKINEGLLNPDVTSIDIPEDHKKCGFGIWLHSDWVTKTAKEHTDFAAIAVDAGPGNQSGQ